jgi:hypothetical protein
MLLFAGEKEKRLVYGILVGCYMVSTFQIENIKAKKGC